MKKVNSKFKCEIVLLMTIEKMAAVEIKNQCLFKN
jgi:hypothetical protein